MLSPVLVAVVNYKTFTAIGVSDAAYKDALLFENSQLLNQPCCRRAGVFRLNTAPGVLRGRTSPAVNAP